MTAAGQGQLHYKVAADGVYRLRDNKRYTTMQELVDELDRLEEQKQAALGEVQDDRQFESEVGRLEDDVEALEHHNSQLQGQIHGLQKQVEEQTARAETRAGMIEQLNMKLKEITEH